MTRNGKSPYTKIKFEGQSAWLHRLSYEVEYGPIPPGYEVDHVCRNTRCYNPFHLRAVSPGINSTENTFGAAAINKLKTHCKRGHEFTKENTYVYGGGRYRRCRACRWKANGAHY